MNLKHPDLKKIPLSHSLEHFFHRIGRDPFLDWQLIITLSFFAALVFAVVGYNEYSSVALRLQQSDSDNKNDQPKAVFDETAFKRVLQTYDSRASETRDLESGYHGATDPAL